MTVSLDPIQIVSPVVTGVLSVDSETLPVEVITPGACDTLTASVWGHSGGRGEVEISQVTSTAWKQEGVQRRFTISIPMSPDAVYVRLFGSAGPDTTPQSTITLLVAPTPGEPAVHPPTGVTIHRGRSSCRVEWTTPDDEGFLGVRVQVSPDPSGISVPYSQVGDLVTKVSRTAATTVTTDVEVQENSQKTERVTITREAVLPTNFSSKELTPTVGGAEEFYVLLSTVVQDPETHTIFESAYSGPFRCSTVDLRSASPKDFPYMQSKEDIAGRMIAEVLKDYPNLDLTPRSELRDLHIDPLALELSEGSVRSWFARCADNVSALVQIDDLDGDGFSDPVTTSPIKQQLARAWYMGPEDLQALIDKQFDLLADRNGLKRGGSLQAITQLTIFTHNKPTKREVVEAGAVVSTIPDPETPALQFTTLVSAVFDPNSVESYYDPEHSWWAITVPARCTTLGSIGNVGAKTIRQPIAGVPVGYSCTNLISADYGRDKEPNIKLAERIQDRLVAGVDTGTRRGYLGTARAVPGVTEARVVASGDLEMLRDWDPTIKRHTYGTVDVYVRGNNTGQQDTHIPHVYSPVSVRSVLDQSTLTLTYTPSFQNPMAVLEALVQGGNKTFYLGVRSAAFRHTPSDGRVWVDLSEEPYTYTQDGDDLTTRRRVTKAQDPTFPYATNGDLLRAMPPGTIFTLQFRQGPALTITPTYQPVLGSPVVSGATGSLPPTAIRLVRSQDPLLLGGSNKANDSIQLDMSTTFVDTVELFFNEGGLAEKEIATGMAFTLTPNGEVSNVLSVRSKDKVTLYTHGPQGDYTLKRSRGVNGLMLVRTPGSKIPLRPVGSSTGGEVLVSFNKYKTPERVTYVSGEVITLKGSLPSPLANRGVILDPNVPLLYGYDTLTKEMQGKAKWEDRYLMVKYQDTIAIKDRDYSLTTDGDRVSITKILGGTLPDNATVSVSYYHCDTYLVKTAYPTAVQQVSAAIENFRAAGADVVVKNMWENKVDVVMTVELDPTVSPDTIDPKIRSLLTVVMDQSKDKLSQAEVIRQVKSLAGVKSITVPLTRFSKADGSYDIGHIIPTGTKWLKVQDDPKLSSLFKNPNGLWVTATTALPFRTRPSGGQEDDYVGLLYEGQAFTRAMKITDLPSKSTPSFYIIGMGDTAGGVTFLSSDIGRVALYLPPGYDQKLQDPAVLPFRVTYQIWYEGGAQDIPISPSEYLRPGRMSLHYVSTKKGAILQ